MLSTFFSTFFTVAIAYAIFKLATFIVKSQSAYRTKPLENQPMTYERLKELVSIWDKWNYNQRTITCFTLHDILEDGSIGYKPKLWIHATKTQFKKLCKEKELKSRLTNKTDYFFEDAK